MFSSKDFDLNRQHCQDRLREAEQRRLARNAQPQRHVRPWLTALWQALNAALRPHNQRAPQRAPQTSKNFRQPMGSRS